MKISIEQLLEAHSLRKTVVRNQVLDIFLNAREALSHSDIESHFEQVDRITLYRTLKTFEDKGLIHKAIDGSDKPKYALCHSGCDEHEHHDHHAHFHCDDCGKTYCLDEIEAPAVSAPGGFQVASTHLVVTGKCEQCVA
ncbi:MAG: transcriptional repressor [Saprospiraceae bacterium]|nr:transcriptional repressor [Saprospiraceae bacterium]